MTGPETAGAAAAGAGKPGASASTGGTTAGDAAAGAPASTGGAVAGDAPRDQRRPHVEAKLFAALSRLIEQGDVPADIPIGRLSREAGISRATFYLYFADRRAFNLRLVSHGWEVLARPLQDLWDAVTSGESTVEAALYELMRVYRDNGAVMTAVMDAGTGDAEVAEFIQTQIDALIDATVSALEQGQAAGTIRDVPAHETASVLVWMAERACSQLGRTADDDRLRRLAQSMSQLVSRGVVADGVAS